MGKGNEIVKEWERLSWAFRQREIEDTRIVSGKEEK